MNKTNFNEELFDFINNVNCSFTCTDFIKRKLIEKGYLFDTCLNSQDNYEKLVNYFLEVGEN